jgi:hypothetical protein
MGVQQNTMWQQPPPQSTAATNPFAAPSGPSVSDCPLLFFFLCQSAAICRQVILYRVLRCPHIFVGCFFSLSLARFLSLCFSNADISNPLFFFLSLSRRCRRTS